MATTAVPAPQPPLTEAARVINTFVAPSRTFADIRRNQSWWIPWVLLSVMSVAFMLTIQQKIGFEQITRTEISRSSRAEQFEKLPPEQKERQIQINAAVMKYAGYGSPVTLLIVTVIVAGIFMAVFNFGMGAEVSFKQSIAVVFYGLLPSMVGTALALVSLLAGSDPEGFNIKNPVATNPAYFMDPTQHKFLYGMTSGLDVIIIWCIILLGIGYSSISKLKRTTAIAGVAGVYVIYKIIASGLSGLM